MSHGWLLARMKPEPAPLLCSQPTPLPSSRLCHLVTEVLGISAIIRPLAGLGVPRSMPDAVESKDSKLQTKLLDVQIRSAGTEVCP